MFFPRGWGYELHNSSIVFFNFHLGSHGSHWKWAILVLWNFLLSCFMSKTGKDQNSFPRWALWCMPLTHDFVGRGNWISVKEASHNSQGYVERLCLKSKTPISQIDRSEKQHSIFTSRTKISRTWSKFWNGCLLSSYWPALWIPSHLSILRAPFCGQKLQMFSIWHHGWNKKCERHFISAFNA